MKENNNYNEITITKVKNSQTEYTACFYAQFLKATFSISFTDNVFGAVALTKFYEMIKNSFNTKQVNFVICGSQEIDNTIFIDFLNNKKGVVNEYRTSM